MLREPQGGRSTARLRTLIFDDKYPILHHSQLNLGCVFAMEFAVGLAAMSACFVAVCPGWFIVWQRFARVPGIGVIWAWILLVVIAVHGRTRWFSPVHSQLSL